MRAYNNGHRVGVIVGAHIRNKPYGIMLRAPGNWERGVTLGHFVENAKSNKEMAELITAIVSP
jgi:hypothetical protein